MKLPVILLMAFAISFSANAQKKKKQDAESILAMCGCYDITFNYAETFSPDENYSFHDNYKSGALEYVFPISVEPNKIVIQHLLVINDAVIIKHWRQDWLFENTDFFQFDHNNTWKFVQIDKKTAKGQWTQKVYQVDDSPRYEGTATWVHVDGKHYWESTTDAPLPRREFSKRSDYNVMERGNRHETTPNGWVHEQNNNKVIKSNGTKHLLAQEKGMNTYTKTDISRCQPAVKWWAKTQQYWQDVRQVWSEVFDSHTTLQLNPKVNGELLFQRLFALEKEMLKGQYDPITSIQAIRSTIQSHIVSNQNLVTKN